jgi:hypothetical protein
VQDLVWLPLRETETRMPANFIRRWGTWDERGPPNVWPNCF